MAKIAAMAFDFWGCAEIDHLFRELLVRQVGRIIPSIPKPTPRISWPIDPKAPPTVGGEKKAEPAPQQVPS